MLQPSRASSFDYTKRYKGVRWIQGLETEDFSFNELQAILNAERRRLGEGIVQERGILAGLVPTIGAPGGGFTPISIADGLMFLRGRLEPIPGGPFNFPGILDANSAIYVEWLMSQVDGTIDPEIFDPNTLNPIDQRLSVKCSLSLTNPDALDEDFEHWVTSADGITPVYLTPAAGGVVPRNPTYGPWTLLSGSPTSVKLGAARWGYYGLLLDHTIGTQTSIYLSNVLLTPNTAYTVYFATRTVYGQPDLLSGNGVFVYISRTSTTSPMVGMFATSGGTTLLGDYTVHSFTFNSDGNPSPVTIVVGVDAGAATTQILVDSVLITASPLGANDLDRHYFKALSGVNLTPDASPPYNFEILGQAGSVGAVNLVGDKVPSFPYLFRVSASLINLRNPFNSTVLTAAPFNETVNISVAGPLLNGRDQIGVFPPYDGFGTGFFHVYAIGGQGEFFGLIASLNGPEAGGPRLPTGYTHWAYLATLMVNTSGQIYKTALRGSQCQLLGFRTPYKVLLPIPITTTVLSLITAAQIVPPQALEYRILHSLQVVNNTANAIEVQAFFYLDPADSTSTSDGDIDSLDTTIPASSGATIFTVRSRDTIPNAGRIYYAQLVYTGGTPTSAALYARALAYTVPNNAA